MCSVHNSLVQASVADSQRCHSQSYCRGTLLLLPPHGVYTGGALALRSPSSVVELVEAPTDKWLLIGIPYYVEVRTLL